LSSNFLEGYQDVYLLGETVFFDDPFFEIHSSKQAEFDALG